jgi:hypothetical protein
MSNIDLGNAPVGTPPTVAQQKQLRTSFDIQAEPVLVTPTTSPWYLASPTNGSYLGEKYELIIRPDGVSVDFDIDNLSTILIPSDSGITFPKTLLANHAYFIMLRWDGNYWCLVSFVGGYSN